MVMILRRLAAADLRRSLCQKRVDTLPALRQIRDGFVLEFHLLVERVSGRAVEQTSHPSVSARGAVGQFISHRFRHLILLLSLQDLFL
jgi:hypothetical protein